MPQSTIYVADPSPGGAQQAPPPAVATYGLARLFAGSPALVDLSLRVDPGRIVALIGGNGAGKTTLLRLMASAIRPSFGRVEIGGLDTGRHVAAVRSQVAYLSHAAGLYDDLTAAENLRFAAELRCLAPDRAPEAVADALRRVGLAALAGERVGGFSVGMRRRVAIARLLLGEPRLVLLDEPYAGLDADGMSLVDALLPAWRAAGATVIVATHAVERLASGADGIVRLDGGLLVELAGGGVGRTAAPVVSAISPVPGGATR